MQYVEEALQLLLPYAVDTRSRVGAGRVEVAQGPSATVRADSSDSREGREELAALELDKTETTRDVDLSYHDRILTRDMQLAMELTTSQVI